MHEAALHETSGLSPEPVLVASWRVSAGEAGAVMERLAWSLVTAARSWSSSHAGVVWLDSGGGTLSGKSESVLAGFSWRRLRFDDARTPGLPEALRGLADDGAGTGTHGEGLRFRGGWMGFLGYEAVEAFEPVRLSARRDVEVPVASWGLYPVWFRLPAHGTRLELWSRLERDVAWGPAGPRPRLAQWREWARQAIAKRPGGRGDDAGPVRAVSMDASDLVRAARRSFSRAGFLRAVGGVKAAVREGEVFQANLAHRLGLTTEADPFQVYRVLRRLNPSPFMGFLQEDWGALVSNSPERLFCVRRVGQNRVVEARPIAGTRPRGGDAGHEARLRSDLCTSAKERAEHTMLLDLVRNDVGRVSSPGSVRVTSFQQVEAYSHVLHLVSRVKGVLREDAGLDDLLRALFPGGTITGAPKLRSIEVIDRFEEVARGPYTGSLGYVNPDGSMDLNILIRTIVMRGGSAYASAGAGIVADSDPVREYEETIHKATAMLLALQAAGARPRRVVREVASAEDQDAEWVHAARRGRVWPALGGEA